MCGLAGALSLDGAPVQHTAIRAMTEALRHRGPDEGAVILLDGPAKHLGPRRRGPAGEPGRSPARIGLGHRRLKVIDLSRAAAQPMRSQDGAGWLVYNGEIYNAAELRAELESRGARFRSHSDTEVALQALCAWGPEAPARFEGMFSLAFWDARQGRLLLARDRFGEKPLYYGRSGGLFLFASELGALTRGGELQLEIDPEAFELYLTLGFVPAPWTIYRGLHKLPHASCLLLGAGGESRLWRYYRLEERLQGPLPRRPEEDVRDLLQSSVARRLEADVPLGAFLSGGIDSTAVVACMRRARGTAPLTYSMGIPDLPYFDETGPARRSAGLLETQHHEIPVDTPRLQREIPFVLGRLDEPFADSSALASSVVCGAARQDLTVALSGDGGDELFGGYRLFRALAAQPLVRCLPSPVRRALALLLSPFPSRYGAGGAGIVRQALRLLEGGGADLALAHASWMSLTDAGTRGRLRPGVPESDRARQLVQERYRRFGGGLRAALATEIDLALPDDMLVKVDRTSMSHALEVRAPFLDTALVELALRLPPESHFGVLSGKRLLRRALRGLVPAHVLRGPKRGFEVPVGDWLTGPLLDLFRDVVAPRALASLPGIDPAAVDPVVEEHRTRRRDHGRALWMLFALCFWEQGPHRSHLGWAADARRQPRAFSSSEAIVLRSSEG